MKKALITIMAFFWLQSPLSANDELELSPMSGINISKENILKSLEELKKQGKISDSDLEKAKKELSDLSDSQIKSMTKTAVDIIEKDPNKAMELMNLKKIDNDEVKKKIEK